MMMGCSAGTRKRALSLRLRLQSKILAAEEKEVAERERNSSPHFSNLSRDPDEVYPGIYEGINWEDAEEDGGRDRGREEKQLFPMLFTPQHLFKISPTFREAVGEMLRQGTYSTALSRISLLSLSLSGPSF